MNFLDTLEYIDDQCGHWQRQASPLTVRITSPGFDSNGEQGTSTWACTDCAPVVIALFDREYGGHDEHPKVTKTAEQPAQLALGDAAGPASLIEELRRAPNMNGMNVCGRAAKEIERLTAERDEARAWADRMRQEDATFPWEEST